MQDFMKNKVILETSDAWLMSPFPGVPVNQPIILKIDYYTINWHTNLILYARGLTKYLQYFGCIAEYTLHSKRMARTSHELSIGWYIIEPNIVGHYCSLGIKLPHFYNQSTTRESSSEGHDYQNVVRMNCRILDQLESVSLQMDQLLFKNSMFSGSIEYPVMS